MHAMMLSSLRTPLVAQVAHGQAQTIFGFTSLGDVPTQAYARSLGRRLRRNAARPLDASTFLRRSGVSFRWRSRRSARADASYERAIHMSDIPRFPYALLWEERELLSVANLTRLDGVEFLSRAPTMGIVTHTTTYPLQRANEALADLRAGRFMGAAVLVP